MLWLRSRWGSALLSLSLALAWALMLACAFPAIAQEEPPPEAVELSAEVARFLIETITVETDRTASAGIIESETLLKEGTAYTEDDLRQAIARVHRLPFVLDADLSLRKGSERGSYELVIQTYTARWFFYDRWVQVAHFDQEYTLGDVYTINTGNDLSQTGLVGGRVFLGRSGVLYGSVGYHDDLVIDGSDGLGSTLGYTQYDLFGRGIVADVTFGDCCSSEVLPFGIDPTLTSWSWGGGTPISLSLAVPLSPNRSFQAGWTEHKGEASNRRSVLDPYGTRSDYNILEGDQAFRRMEARWVHDTSDDPVLPSRGTEVSAGLEYSRYQSGSLRAEQHFPDQPPFEVELPSFEGEQLAAIFGATRHWSLTPRQSVSAGGRLILGRSRIRNLQVIDQTFPEAELTVYGGSMDARYLLRLWSLREPGSPQDVFVELTASYGAEATSPNLGFRENALERLNLSVGLTYRHRWGRLRFVLAYLQLGEMP